MFINEYCQAQRQQPTPLLAEVHLSTIECPRDSGERKHRKCGIKKTKQRQYCQWNVRITFTEAQSGTFIVWVHLRSNTTQHNSQPSLSANLKATSMNIAWRTGPSLLRCCPHWPLQHCEPVSPVHTCRCSVFLPVSVTDGSQTIVNT